MSEITVDMVRKRMIGGYLILMFDSDTDEYWELFKQHQDEYPTEVMRGYVASGGRIHADISLGHATESFYTDIVLGVTRDKGKNKWVTSMTYFGRPQRPPHISRDAQKLLSRLASSGKIVFADAPEFELIMFLYNMRGNFIDRVIANNNDPDMTFFKDYRGVSYATYKGYAYKTECLSTSQILCDSYGVIEGLKMEMTLPLKSGGYTLNIKFTWGY